MLHLQGSSAAMTIRNGNNDFEPPGPAAPLALISAYNIVKRFGNLAANEVERFDVCTGEVHGLLGENGAGKSTLSKILYGYYRPDSGEIRVRGLPVHMRTPAEARSLGIGMVFQDFTLIPALSVFENIALFMEKLPRILNRRALAKQIADAASTLRMTIDLQVPAGALSVGEQQKIEILKQVLAGARVLLLDEPTKVLAPPERAGLFETLAQLRSRGYGIVLITHKINEVLEAADRISVMRKGRIAGVLDRSAATQAGLLALMFEGRSPRATARRAVRSFGRDALELRDVSTTGEAHAVPLDDVSLRVREGEILGMAGIAGSGQRELGALIVGTTRPQRGTKMLLGQDAGDWPIARVRQSGVAFVPENPLEIACVGELSVAENFALGERRYRRGLGIDWPRVEVDAESAFARLGFPRPALHAGMRTLSGGNVQRVVMARELAVCPRIIVALYPTRGLDFHSAQAVRDKLTASAAEGAAVLLVSEDLDELFELSDRLVVLRQGRIAGEFEPAAFAPEAVGAAMVGTTEMQHAN
jgi:simple sugar transport system ATP-binding protein